MTPKAHGNGPKASYDPQGEREWAKTIRTNHTNARAYGNLMNAHEGTRRPLERTGMDRTHPMTPKGHVNGQDAPYDPQGARKWAKTIRTNRTNARAYGNLPNAHEGTRRPLERTGRDQSTERTPGRTRMDLTHTNEPDNSRGAGEWTECTPTNPTTHGAREWTERTPTNPTTPTAHGNGPYKPDDSRGAREWTERTQTNPKTPLAHANGPNAHQRTRRPTWHTGMD